MSTRSRFVTVVTVGLPLLLAIGWLYEPKAAQPEDAIKYRRAVMKSQGGHMGAAAEIVRGKVDFAADLGYHAQALEASVRTITKLFPDGSDLGDTRAKPEIWKRRADFDKAAQNTERAAAAFLTAVKSNDKAAIGKNFGALADACKGCHQDFREKE